MQASRAELLCDPVVTNLRQIGSNRAAVMSELQPAFDAPAMIVADDDLKRKLVLDCGGEFKSVKTKTAVSDQHPRLLRRICQLSADADRQAHSNVAHFRLVEPIP